MNADEICAQFGKYVAGTCQQTDTRLCDIPEQTEAPELVVPGPPLPNDMSVVMLTVGYACVPLPSVNNGVMPELIRMPVFPQTMGRAMHGENMVPRWRLAREGPFLEERSPESIRSLGPGVHLETQHTEWRTMPSRRESSAFC